MPKAVEVLLTRWQKRKNIPVSVAKAPSNDDLKMRSIMEFVGLPCPCPAGNLEG